MRALFAVSTLAALAFATAASAGISIVPGPAPLIGAGLPSLGVLAVAGAGYLAVRMRRRNRD
jgi:hypothetical protein